MTQDDITRMAREAGFVGLVDHPSLARFAALVAALAQEQAEPVGPCSTCVSLARAVMMDQEGHA